MSDPAPSRLPDSALQSALEFAIGIAAAGAKLRPPLVVPQGLKPFTRFHKLPPTALAAVRSAIESDPEFLRRLGMVATADLVDQVGMLWLTRPDGWDAQARQLAAAAAPAEPDGARDTRREERRRVAAEAVAARARLEVADLRATLGRERSVIAETVRERDRLAAEVATLQKQLAESERARVRADKAAARARERESANDSKLAEAIAARDAALIGRADTTAAVPFDIERLRQLLAEANGLVTSVPGQVPPAGRRKATPRRRKPLSIPGGLLGDSVAAAEHLLRTPGVQVLLDGYNVAKLGWPTLDLEHQRRACIEAAENVARRWGTAIGVVFDGADVPGAHSAARRLVRISYSPGGVPADDVLRAEVRAFDPATPVVVVTNDQAVVADVRAAGANVVTSDIFLQLARR